MWALRAARAEAGESDRIRRTMGNRHLRRAGAAGLGLLVSAVFGWLALRSVSVNQLGAALARARYGWVVPASAALLVAVWLRSERWRALFPGHRRPHRASTFWALNVGCLFNAVLPARAGEGARVLALSRDSGIPRVQCMTTVVVERIFDLAALAAILLATYPLLPHRPVDRELTAVSIVILAVTAATTIAASPRSRLGEAIRRLPPVRRRNGERFAGAVGEGLLALRSGRTAVPVLALSLGSWILLYVCTWCLMQGFDPSVPWTASVLVLVTTSLAQAIPSSGGALGVFEAGARAALSGFAIAPATAVSYALVLHAVTFLPPVALGVVGLGKLGLARHRRNPTRPAMSERLRPAAAAPAWLDVSIVIPCLDERPTIAGCVRNSWIAIRQAGVSGEVIVVDNGSTDGSDEAARRAGARVVREQRRGYGSAYLAGLRAAGGRFILMGDGDGTYDFGELERFLALARDGADIVLGSRIRGSILPGAMPWHHRWIGNPLLTGILNLLYRAGVSDAHCGLRMVRRSALPALGLRTPGMEFASEMVIKASRVGLRISEAPIVYRPRPDGSTSKLNSIRDGLRHLRYLFACAPAPALWSAPLVAALAGGGLLLDDLNSVPAIDGSTAVLALGLMLANAAFWLRAYRGTAIEPSAAWGHVAAWVRPVAIITSTAVVLAGCAVLGTLVADGIHPTPVVHSSHADHDAAGAPPPLRSRA